MKTVYVLEFQGSEFISENVDDVLAELRGMLTNDVDFDLESEYKCYAKEMTTGEFCELSEFEGF